MRKGSECFSSLELAWEEAIEPYKKREPALYEFHQTCRFGDHVSRILAVLPDQRAAAKAAARILASLCYPAFAQTVDAKSSWFVLFDFLGKCIAETEHMNISFQLTNPHSFTVFENRCEEPFTKEAANALNQFFRRWAIENKIRW